MFSTAGRVCGCVTGARQWMNTCVVLSIASRGYVCVPNASGVGACDVPSTSCRGYICGPKARQGFGEYDVSSTAS